MRAIGIVMPILLAACSQRDDTANSVDVAAAAARAETDIANYVAARRDAGAPARARRPRAGEARPAAELPRRGGGGTIKAK